MLYRVHILLAFPDSKSALKSRESAVAMFPNAITINPGLANEEKSYIIVEECFHDTDPTLPCNVLEEYHSE